MQVNNDADITRADALVQLAKAARLANDVGSVGGTGIKTALADVLDLTNPGWREDESIVGRIKDVGAGAAAEAMLRKHLT